MSGTRTAPLDLLLLRLNFLAGIIKGIKHHQICKSFNLVSSQFSSLQKLQRISVYIPAVKWYVNITLIY